MNNINVSILFPTSQRKEQALACLNTLIPTIQGKDCEVIAIIDADMDSCEAVKSLLSKSDVPFIIDYSDKLRGLSGAFNAGLAIARGSNIAISADDLSYTDGWLEACLAQMATMPDGGVVTFNDSHWDGEQLGTHYMISRAFIVEHLGGRIAWDVYHHSMHDVEINERAKALGRYRWAKDALVKHNHWNYGERPQDDSDKRRLARYAESQTALDMRRAANWPDDEPRIIGKVENKLRIGWLVDVPEYEGGAEMVAKELAAQVPDNVVLVPCPPNDVSEDVDAYVLQNCTSYRADIIPKLALKPVFKVIHDEWPHSDPDLRRWLLHNATTLFFSSPLHRETFKFEVTAPVVIAPINVNAAPFERAAASANGSRKGYCWIGRMWPGKGIDNAIRYARERNISIDFYGFGPDSQRIQPPGMYRGQVEYKDIPAVLARYDTFVFLPDTIEPYSRTTVEAWLAGCKVIINKNVGAGYWIQNDPAAITHSKFWQTILDAVSVKEIA